MISLLVNAVVAYAVPPVADDKEWPPSSHQPLISKKLSNAERHVLVKLKLKVCLKRFYLDQMRIHLNLP